MATNPYVNKVQKADGSVIIDLTSDTLDASKVLSGYTGHDASGAPFTGTIVDGDEIGYGDYIPAIVGQAMVGFSIVGEQTQPVVGTALVGLTQI